MAFDVVLTLGPASERDDVLVRLAATATRFRLNGSHLAPDDLDAWLERIVDLGSRLGRPLGVVVDLQGAKMRVGRMPAVSALPEEVELVLASSARRPGLLPVPHPRLFQVLQPGETLTLADRRVELRVVSVGPDAVRARVLRNGPLKPGAGLNRVDHPLVLDELVPTDRALIEVGDRRPFVSYALSFVQGPACASLVRRYTNRAVAGKLERPEALADLDGLARAFDELWLCRGDLGAQAGLERLGPLQETVTRRLADLPCPVLLAGGVFEHMVGSPTPARSEVVHLHDVRRAGWAGVVLSDETAVGGHPVAVAEALDLLLGAPLS